MTKGTHPIPRFFVLALALQLAACATPERFSAANDVHAFLISVRDNDRAAFNAHVDRRALEAQMRQAMLQKVDQAQVGTSLKLLGALLAVPTSRAVPQAEGCPVSENGPLPGSEILPVSRCTL